MKKKKVRIVVIAILSVFFILIAAAVAFKLYAGNYYKADETIVEEFRAKTEESVHTYKEKDGMLFMPVDQELKAVIVFYPGGKVEYTAYSGLMYELASRGFICVLPRMPENLAFLRINAVDILTEKYPTYTDTVSSLDWYIAGHSLGGVAASTYLVDNIDKYVGMILCASYTPSDFSGSDLRLLSIYGSEDKVLSIENYEANKVHWPADAQEYVIWGGIHSYFGDYGIQKGDGEPAITNEQQIEETADVIVSFVENTSI